MSDTVTVGGTSVADLVSDSLDRIETALDGKQATISNLADTSKYIEYADTTALIGMQWELDGKISNTGGTINGTLHINSGDDYTPLTLEGNGSGNSASFILNDDGDLTLQPSVSGTKVTIGGNLDISNNNIIVTDSTASIILKDSIGKNWKIKVNTGGQISADSTGLN